MKKMTEHVKIKPKIHKKADAERREENKRRSALMLLSLLIEEHPKEARRFVERENTDAAEIEK